VVEYLPNKCEALSSNLNTIKKKNHITQKKRKATGHQRKDKWGEKQYRFVTNQHQYHDEKLKIYTINLMENTKKKV
jgi:hypothetical protein